MQFTDLQVELTSPGGKAYARLLIGYPYQLEGDLNDLPYGLIENRDRPVCYLASLHADPSHHGLGTLFLGKLPKVLKNYPEVKEIYTLAWATHHSHENPTEFYLARGFKFISHDVTDHPYLSCTIGGLAQFAPDTPCLIKVRQTTGHGWSAAAKVIATAAVLVTLPLVLKPLLCRRRRR